MRKSETAWVALSLCKNLGGKTFRALLTHFNDDLDAILQADVKELRQVRGIGAKIAQSIRSIHLEQTQQHIERWQQAGVCILTWDDPEFPQALRTLDDAPPTLFVVGQLRQRTPAYAVVGTRSPSEGSIQTAQRISAEIAEQGYSVVSGLAAGIDTWAHLGALSVRDGHTVAVLGSGVLNIYPKENQGLASAIMARGALLCEVAPDVTVAAPGLVARNRLISGLSQAIVVIQTEADGGAMHAARFAKLQGRLIYAVDNAATGNQQLIAEGAIPLAPDERLF